MKENLYIGEFSDLYFPSVNGVVRVVDKLSEALDKKANVFASVCKMKYDKTPPYRVLYCKGFRIPIQGDTQSLVGLDRKFKKKIFSEKLDIIHLHTIGGQFKIAKKLAKKKNIPVVITVHTQTHYDLLKFFKSKKIVNFLMKGIVKKYNSCDEIWALNEGMKNYCIEWGCDPKKIRIVGNACDYSFPQNTEELIEDTNKRFALSPDETVFCFLGRLIDYKNIYFIARSLKVLKDKGDKFKMIYVGDGIDRKKLETLIRDLNLENDVIITGTITDKSIISGILLRSKLLLFPSMFDSFGLVILEAAAHKTPSLLIENSVAASSFIDCQNVFTAKEDPSMYAQKIIDVLSDPLLYNKVAENCLTEVCCSWEDYSDFILSQYREVIDNFHKSSKTD